MRDYGKVYSTFWTSQTIRSMSEDSRNLAMYLLTCPHNTIAGVFRLPDGYVCDDLQWESERVSKGFAELFEKGFASRCETTKWVWVNKHLEWNPPENPNQRKSVEKVASSIPDPCAWKADFMRECWGLVCIEQKALINPSATVPKPEAVTEAVTEEKPLAIGKPNCPHQEIINLYHEILPASPRIKDWTTARATSLRARWNEGTDRQTLDYWKSFFEYVSGIPFLTGKVATNGRRPFIVSLDWLLKPENFAKVREGRYEDNQA